MARGRRGTEANLRGANLQGADLSSVDMEALKQNEVQPDEEAESGQTVVTNIRPTNLENTDFRDADLSNAKLSTVINLQSGQLAGTNLSNAKLPSDIRDFQGLRQVEENSKHARNIFLAMVAACFFVWLTIATTTDVALVLNSSGTPLPIINAAMPIAWFYWTVPAIMLALYFYLHFYLQSMWDGLGELPAIFPDGRRLEKTAYPWLLTSLVSTHVPKLKEDRPKPLASIALQLQGRSGWVHRREM